jgi:hypothetical protein
MGLMNQPRPCRERIDEDLLNRQAVTENGGRAVRDDTNLMA